MRVRGGTNERNRGWDGKRERERDVGDKWEREIRVVRGGQWFLQGIARSSWWLTESPMIEKLLPRTAAWVSFYFSLCHWVTQSSLQSQQATLWITVGSVSKKRTYAEYKCWRLRFFLLVASLPSISIIAIFWGHFWKSTPLWKSLKHVAAMCFSKTQFGLQKDYCRHSC